MRISDLLDLIEDDDVPIREESVSPGRIEALTLRKLHRKKKRLGRGAMAVLIAAILLALSAAAYASGLFSRLVDWHGRTVEAETEPMATVPPDAVMIGDGTRDAVVADILARRGDRELVIVRDGSSAFSTERTAPVASVGELKALLTAEDSPLCVPLGVPAGYTLTTGQVCYASAPGYGYTLVSSETRADGLTVEHYAAPAEGDFISGYALEFGNAEGDTLYIIADMMTDTADMDFGVWDGSEAVPFTVAGMDDALCIRDENGASVFLRRALTPPVRCESCFALMGPDDACTDYDSIIYHIRAERLSAEALQGMLISR